MFLAVGVEVLGDGEQSSVLSTRAAVGLEANLVEFSNGLKI